MPKLAIIDHVVSAAGVERFLQGMVSGLLDLPECRNWEIHVLLAPKNSGGFPVQWPEHIAASNLQIHYLPSFNAQAIANRLYSKIFALLKKSRLINYLPFSYQDFLIKREDVINNSLKLWIEKYCSKNRYDVVYFSYPYMMECPSLPMPIVITMHDFNYKQFGTLGDELRAKIDNQTPLWLDKTKGVVVSSEFIADQLRMYYPLYSSKTQIVRAGIPESKNQPSASDFDNIIRKQKIPKKFLLTVGWIVPHKNQKVIFEALAQLRNQGIDIALVCAGPNSEYIKSDTDKYADGYIKEILDFISEAGLQEGKDYVALGYVSDFDLKCLYRMATALVVSSLYEAGSFPLLEAVRSLCPVICSNIPALVEQAELLDRQIYLFDPANPRELSSEIEKIIFQPDVAVQRATKAAGLVNQVYSWSKMAKGYLTVFQEAAESKHT